MLLVQQISKQEVLLFGYFILTLLVLGILFIVFFVTFQKSKSKLLIERALQEKEFEKTLATAAHEIREETFKNIGMELHDNVGQLLSVATMQINAGLTFLERDKKEPFIDAKETIGTSLEEIRSLSKTINGNVMSQWRLYDAIEEEVKRLNKSGILTVSYIVNGEVFEIPQKEKIIIFRIIQECCSNVIKHANATQLDLAAIYVADSITILISDNGNGFDMASAKRGSGLINMESRAALIGAMLEIKSTPRNGTEITLKYSPKYDNPN